MSKSLVPGLNYQLSEISQRRLLQLKPCVQQRVIASLNELALAGYGRLSILETYRSYERQCTLYGQGRTPRQLASVGLPSIYAKPSLKVVTGALPGTSLHGYGLAVDVLIDVYPKSHWSKIGAVFKRHGFIWGGDWKMRDYRHFEYRGSLSLSEIFAGKVPT